jgi:hypothetical protein
LDSASRQGLVLDIEQHTKKEYEKDYQLLLDNSHIAKSYLGNRTIICEGCHEAVRSSLHLFCEIRRRQRLKRYVELAGEDLSRTPKFEDVTVGGACTEGLFDKCKKEFNTSVESLVSSATLQTTTTDQVVEKQRKRFCNSCGSKYKGLANKVEGWSATNAWIEQQLSHPLSSVGHKRSFT